MEYKLVGELIEAWKDHPDSKGLLKAAHSPKNCLLVYWYNPFTGDFRKVKEVDSHHKNLDIFGLDKEELPGWLRGRVFKFNDKVYLMVYIFGSKIINTSFLDDIYNLVYQTLGLHIDNVIDDNGDSLLNLFENWKNYSKDKLKLIKECINGIQISQ